MTSPNITTNIKKITIRTEINKVDVTTKFEGGQGPGGISAYAVAVKNGFIGTEEQWLASLQGDSAYQTWLSLGNTGTEQDFLDSITNDCLIYTFAFSS